MHAFDRQTDSFLITRPRDSFLIAIPHLHCMQRGKNLTCLCAAISAIARLVSLLLCVTFCCFGTTSCFSRFTPTKGELQQSELLQKDHYKQQASCYSCNNCCQRWAFMKQYADHIIYFNAHTSLVSTVISTVRRRVTTNASETNTMLLTGAA